jgi:chromosome segregation ATPase
MRHRHWTAAAFSVWIIGANAPLQAQTQRSGGGETQKIMQQYQQVAAEKTALQAQLEQTKRNLDAANAELAAMKKERDAAKAHAGISPALLAQANTAKESAEQSLEQSRRRMNELVGKFRETAASLREIEADRSKLRKDLSDGNAAFDACAASNLQLYEINRDILDRYEHIGLFTRVSADEPFTRITRTRIENLVDEYRERAQELRLKKQSP